MIAVSIGIVAALALVVIIFLWPWLGRSAIVPGVAGMVAGFLLGIVVDVTIGLMHWFGPIDIPNPVVQIGQTAMTLGDLYPMIFGTVGLCVGVVIATLRKKRGS